MAKEQIHITRGNLVESIHTGDIVVVNKNKEIIASCGDPDKYTYTRSTAKPVQALEIILSGAADHYGLTEEELAVACSSHYGEERHIQVVSSILNKINLTENTLQCGISTSLSYNYALSLARRNVADNQLINDCSGKHAGMLAVCQKMGYPLQNYLDPKHPLQKKILENISLIYEYPQDKIEIGIDGCTAPVFATPLYNMAVAYMNLINPVNFDPEMQKAINRIYDSVVSYPFMIAGTNGFCTELMKATNKRIIGKIGAEGVYCIGIKDRQIALALKIENGSMAVIPPVAMEVLTKLELLSAEEYSKLEKWHYPDNLNIAGIKVGKIKPIFELHRAE